MGIYLSAPNAQKNPEDITDGKRRCGINSIQGFQKNTLHF